MVNQEEYLKKIEDAQRRVVTDVIKLRKEEELLRRKHEQAVRIIQNIKWVKNSSDMDNRKLAQQQDERQLDKDTLREDPVYLKLQLFTMSAEPHWDYLSYNDRDVGIIRSAKARGILSPNNDLGIIVLGQPYFFNEILVEKKIYPLLRKMEDRTMTQGEYDEIKSKPIEELALAWDAQFPSRWYFDKGTVNQYIRVNQRGRKARKPLPPNRLSLQDRISLSAVLNN